MPKRSWYVFGCISQQVANHPEIRNFSHRLRTLHVHRRAQFFWGEVGAERGKSSFFTPSLICTNKNTTLLFLAVIVGFHSK